MTARLDRTYCKHPVRFGLAALVSGAAGLMAPIVSRAQMPPDLVEKVAAMGRVVDPENTGKLYAPL